MAFHEIIQQVQTFAWTFLHLFAHWSVTNVIFMCKRLCFWLASEKVDKNSIYQNLLFFGEEKENAKKEGTHRDGLLGEEIFMVQFPRDFPQLLTSIFQSSFFFGFAEFCFSVFPFFSVIAKRSKQEDRELCLVLGYS